MLTLTSPVETKLHRIAAGWKLAALAGFTVTIFTFSSPLSLAASAGAVFLLHLPGGWPFLSHAARMLRPLLWFFVLISLWHLWTGEIREGAVILLRMITAVAAANLVTMTTRLADMLSVLETLFRPLSPLIPPSRLALALALVIRFTPRLGEALARIREGWRARSLRRPGWRILQPGVLAALDDADHASEALRARGGAE